MKKLVVLLSIMVVLTGCVNMNNYSIDNIVNRIIKKDSKLKNVNFEGYSYYIPKGYKFLQKKQYNAIISDKDNNKFYLYIDIVSKYHNIKKKYKVNDDVYYSKSIKGKDKYGYLEITKSKNKYFIEAMYNYMKIEAYVDEKDFKNALSDISLILSSIKYNDKILDTIIGENKFSYREEIYNIFDTKDKSGNFLDYVKEYDYDKDKEEQEKDEDQIKVDEE